LEPRRFPAVADAVRGTGCPVGERADLGLLERPRPARRQVAEPHGADADAGQPDDRHAEGGEHPAKLPLPALREHGAVPDEGPVRRRIERLREVSCLPRRGRPEWSGQAGKAFLQPDAGCDLLLLLRGQIHAQPDGVLPLNAEPRMEDPLGPLTVVREEQQPLRIEIEAAHGIEPRPVRHEGCRDEVENGRLGVPIACRRRHACRLVERDVRSTHADTDRDPIDPR